MSEVDKSKSPYFDDYNAEKNYHEILFRPRRAVQVRELNQLQSMFNEQIQRFGNHTFEDGSVVIPGETNYDLELNYVKVNISNYSSIVGLLGSDNITLEDNNGVTASVKIFTEITGTDEATFYIEYLQASDDDVTFSQGSIVDIILNHNTIGNATVVETGFGSKFTINSGVYYINGRFVLVERETVLLDKYSNTPSKVVGIEYNEVIVTESEDNTMFDNAQGTPNFSAPGAHRLRVDTNLVVYDLADIDTIPDNVVEIFRIENGAVQRTYRGPEYNILGDVLAQRTYEESGNYTVKPFNIGFNSYEEVFGTADDTKVGVQLDSGIGYVQGYRIETVSKTNLELDKARDTGTINNSSISAGVGYYVLVQNLSALPNVSQFQLVSFRDVSSNELGTARVRYVVETATGQHRLYLFDIKDTSGVRTTSFISDSVTIDSTNLVSFTCDVAEAELKEASLNSLIFPMNVDFVRTLNTNNGLSDTSFTAIKQVTGTTDVSGQVTFTAGTNEVFIAQDSRYAIGSFTDTDDFFDVSGNFTLGGTPTGSIISINLGSGNESRPVRINLQVAKQEVVQKTKATQQTTTSGALTSGVLSLGKADAFEIISVTDGDSNDVTSLFTLNNNKTQSYYGVSSVSTSSNVTSPITVTFKYFSHSNGDFFGPDSYVDVDYEDVPTENGTRLSDVFDFRPRINDAGSAFSGAGAVVGALPVPYSIIRTDVEHYLKRIDKVFVNSDGEFGIAKGLPSLDPSAPSDPANSMVLYTLYVPPYTFAIEDVQAEKINNRRYTMRDIGNIETRLSNVEYYVTLNLLEQEADATQVVDPVTGANRFKNGFFTDRFIDHGSADFSWSGYHVAVDDENGELRPEFSLNAIDLEYVSSESTHVAVNDGMVTLPFEEVSFVRQNQRSETMNVNPYAIYRWTGSLKLNPSMDSWLDTHYVDPDVTYRVFNNGRLTQSWRSWQLNWTGGTTVQNRQFTRTSAPHSVWQSPDAWGAGVWNRGLFRRTTDTFRTTTTTRTNVDVVNDRVLDTSVIPYMRTIDVKLTGTGNRPNCRMNFFFDDTNINQYVRPDGGAFGNPVTTDADGEFNATFRIPNNQQNKFRTGEKLVVATDEQNNQQQLSTSYAQATFTSTGTRQVRRQTIVATRSTTSNTDRVRRVWSDPLAQSFLIEQRGGAFITRIKTYFATKDQTVPVTVQIREMENGLPTQRIVPGGEKLLLPSQVPTSTDGSVSTDFVFDHPVYLQDGQEYCFVLMSNSNAYNAFVGRMGEIDLATGRYIVKQPYAGVMFKSQNNSTWTADQQADLQFEIMTAKFDTSQNGLLMTQNADLPSVLLTSNPIQTEIGSSTVVINRVNHNYVVGSRVAITDAVGGNNITEAELNRDHVVASVIDPNHFTVDLDQSADATGDIGGSIVAVSDMIQASLLNPNLPVIDVPNTSIAIEAKGTTGQSIDGVETPYLVQSGYISIDNDAINELSAPWLITNRNDEMFNTSNQRTFKLRCTLASTNENVSPLIDLQGANVITPFAQVTRKDSIEPNGSNNWANYRTRVNPLANAADMFKVYLDIKTVDPSNVVVSVRTANSEEEMSDAEWVQVPNITTDVLADGNNFYEYEFEKTGLSQFTFYQVMIQLKSNNSASYPVCRRLRVIALSDFV